MINIFFFFFLYKDGQENVYNEQGINDPMGNILTQITDLNIVLESITSQQPASLLKKNC